MDFASLVFYALATLTVFSGAMVVTARNPVYSVLFLIFAFFNAAGLFVLLGAEYLAMTLVIVYVGAVAVLFLFVVMMLNINLAELRQGFLRYLPLGALLATVLFAELYHVLKLSAHSMRNMAEIAISNPIPAADKMTNTEAIGALLYTDYALPFELSGLVLLVAMVGAIMLTLRHRPDARRQNIAKQVYRRREESVVVVKVATGEGV